MNNLSWFIYLSDVVGNLQPALAVSAGLAVILGGLCALIGFVEDWEDGPKTAKKLIFWFAIPAIIVSCLIPSRTTMYAIAASQVGEQVAKSEEVRGMASDATKALQQWIKKQIEPAPAAAR